MIARPRRLAALRSRSLLAATALTVVAVTMLVSPSAAAPNQPTIDRAQLSLTLTSIDPVSVSPGGQLRIDGHIATDLRVQDIYVRLEVGTSPFISRTAIAEAASTPPSTTPVSNAFDQVGTIQAGQQRRFSVTIPTDDLSLTTPGVYPMSVVVSQGQFGEAVTEEHSFLPWVPEGLGPSPSRLLMFWPMIDTPHRDAAGAVTAPGLRAELRPHGRLTTLLDVGSQADVSWLVDPSVVSDVKALGTASARSWLSKLPTALGPHDVSALPYGDPDLAAVTTADEPRMLREATQRGSRIMTHTLGRPVRTDLGWPADGEADATTISGAHRAGSTMLLLSADTMPLVNELPYTPSGRVAWPQPGMNLFLSDPAASSLMASPANSPTGILLSRQRFLAETLLHSLELPSSPRLLVLAPPRRWDPDPRWASTLVDAVNQATWLRPVTIDQALNPSAPTVERSDPTIPEEGLSRMLPSDQVITAAVNMHPTRTFEAILTRPGRLAQPIEDSLFTSLSTAWRADHEAAAESLNATVDRLTTQRAKVRVVSGGGTLSDDRGDLPVTVRNQLDQAVVVKLQVTSDDPYRLRVGTAPQRLRIKAQGLDSASVSLDAVTSGRLGIQAQLLTPGGTPYSEPVHVSVDVRAYGRVALLVFGAVAALMLTAGLIRIGRRIRRSRQASS